jgi:sulfide:quinone oxidoreductase
MKHIVVLGAGTGGTMMANRLARALARDQLRITVVDRDNTHVYQPGLLFLPFGLHRTEEIRRPRHLFLRPEVDLRIATIDRIDPAANIVALNDGCTLPYDLLIVATGSRVVPGETEGLTGPGWYDNAFDFYTVEGADLLGHHLDRWEGGRVVLNIVDMPIKCPVAPLEFVFLADWFFSQRGVRSKTEIVYATPLDGAFTKPRASAVLGDLLESKGIAVESDFAVQRVDTEARTISSWDGRELDYDLLVSIPLHSGSEAIQRSGLADDLGFFPTDKHTLRSRDHANIFALGDTTDLPSSKAGSVAHFQAEVLVENVLRTIEGRSLQAGFDGHANCFIETGFEKAILIDFNYETEPLPGRFPLPGVGPFTLLEESHVNHWGKLGFRWLYWNQLLSGKEIPIDHAMSMAGKWS